MNSISIAPYENSISQGFLFLQIATKFLDDLSPAFISLIQNNIALNKPLKEQRKIDRRMRRCKRICRIENLTAPFIAKQVDIDFEDLDVGKKQDIVDLLIFELITNKK